MELSQFHKLMVQEINRRQANPEPIEFTPLHDLWREIDRIPVLLDDCLAGGEWRAEERQYLVELAVCAYLFMREIDGTD